MASGGQTAKTREDRTREDKEEKTNDSHRVLEIHLSETEIKR
jgi:hypothetical protein